MTGPVLLVLAGYPGVGKSTLLAHALEHGLPIFGPQDDACFRGTRRPARHPEDGASGHEVLASGTWFHEVHLPFLSRLEALPDRVVLHVDLYAMFFVARRLAPVALGPAPVATWPPERLADALANERAYRAVLSIELFRRFGRIVVHTVRAPLADVARRWHAREEALQRKASSARLRHLGEHLFGDGAHAQRIDRAIHQGWLRSLDTLAPDLLLWSELRGDRLALRPYTRR